MHYRLLQALLLLCSLNVFAQVKHKLIPYRQDALWGYADTTGHLVITPQFDAAQLFYNKLAAVERNGKMGYIDSTGNLVVPLKYDRVGNFKDGFAVVQAGQKWGFINKK